MQGYLKTKEGITGSGIRLQDFFVRTTKQSNIEMFPYHSVLINFYQCQLIFRYLMIN